MSLFDIFKPQTPGLTERFRRDDVAISMAGDPAQIAGYLREQKQPTVQRKTKH